MHHQHANYISRPLNDLQTASHYCEEWCSCFTVSAWTDWWCCPISKQPCCIHHNVFIYSCKAAPLNAPHSAIIAFGSWMDLVTKSPVCVHVWTHRSNNSTSWTTTTIEHCLHRLWKLRMLKWDVVSFFWRSTRPPPWKQCDECCIYSLKYSLKCQRIQHFHRTNISWYCINCKFQW